MPLRLSRHTAPASELGRQLIEEVTPLEKRGVAVETASIEPPEKAVAPKTSRRK